VQPVIRQHSSLLFVWSGLSQRVMDQDQKKIQKIGLEKWGKNPTKHLSLVLSRTKYSTLM
jgi:hypothetical protein